MSVHVYTETYDPTGRAHTSQIGGFILIAPPRPPIPSQPPSPFSAFEQPEIDIGKEKLLIRAAEHVVY